MCSLLRIGKWWENELLAGKDEVRVSDAGVVFLDQIKYPIIETAVDPAREFAEGIPTFNYDGLPCGFGLNFRRTGPHLRRARPFQCGL